MSLYTRYARPMVGQSIQARGNQPLEMTEIRKVAPSIFAQEPHESRSSKYVYIPTEKVLQGLQKEGFFPFFAMQSKSRIEGKTEFTKHMLRLRHINAFNAFNGDGENAGEIILINSHDGTSSYQITAGIFRFVCSNGLMIGDTYQDYKVHHKGDITRDVIEATYDAAGNLDTAKEEIQEFKAIELKPEEKKIFAESALMLKYDNKEDSPIDSSQLLDIRRYQDRGNDLWKTFNTIQENTIKGGLQGFTKKGNRTSTRKVKSIDNNVKLNKALWTLTQKMAELKS